MLLGLNRMVGRKLHVSEMIMRPGRVTEEHLDPCLSLPDCRYDGASNGSPSQRLKMLFHIREPSQADSDLEQTASRCA